MVYAQLNSECVPKNVGTVKNIFRREDSILIKQIKLHNIRRHGKKIKLALPTRIRVVQHFNIYNYCNRSSGVQQSLQPGAVTSLVYVLPYEVAFKRRVS